ncbi:MAG TPA: hypothetical protein VIV55_14200 [Flavobacterium sp.]
MKKIMSLFLILTLFYNVLGFYMMFAEQKEQIWVTAMEKTEESKFEVIEMNINPYAYVVDSGFEYVNDDIVINNKTYHVFKKRIQNNVLKLYCLKNSHFDLISKDLKKIVDNQLFDNNSNKENPTKKLLKSFIKDYIPNNAVAFDFNHRTISWARNTILMPKNSPVSGFVTTNYLPPDFV